MQIQRLSYLVPGFVKIASYAVRWSRMITQLAKHRAQTLAFWAKHGLVPTIEAFNTSRRTLFRWQKAIADKGGVLEALNALSRKPRQVRQRFWPQAVKDEIKRLRTEHPNLGKDKVHVLLKGFCAQGQLRLPSISTVGNLIRDMGGLRMFPVKVSHFGVIKLRKRAKKERKPKNFIALYPGHCGSFDTIERIVQGCRRYVITFTDVYGRFSFAWATTSHASQAAKEFLDLITFIFPFPLQHVLTDNGSEFMKHFDTEIRRLHRIHWHTYPKTPKMNSHAERFNRTIQEEYVDYHAQELLDPVRFNQGLMKYLLWYNTERPHYALKQVAPVTFMKTNFPKECQMYLTHTFP